MASSSSQASQRRKPVKKRQPLARSDSSILGTLKSLVTAPLTWFASNDDFEDSKDLKGKRRRLAAAPTEPGIEEDERMSRNKRMRVHSPPKDVQPAHQLLPENTYGYLDLPGAAFYQQYHQPSRSMQSTRSASVTISTPAPQPYDFPFNNNTFVRASTLSRTMSIDPPSRPLSSASAMASIHVPLKRNTSMDSNSFTRSAAREMSLPPLSGRPSFRMRTSMTPQPQPSREISEPPQLNTLVLNPTFVRAPPSQADDSTHGGLSRQPSVTLGSLAESVRSTRSPARQHSSLLFGINVERDHETPRSETAIEKALHELDIYKTPLIPTRLRSSIIPVSSSPSSNMFKSRRASNLVLMQEDKHVSRLGRKGVGTKETSVVNGTKPYAGEGGMKKLLARRKQEVEEEREDMTQFSGVDEISQDLGDRMDDDLQQTREKSDNVLSERDMKLPPPLLPSSGIDSFSVTGPSAVSTSASSLRIGRTKVRAHFARPARPMKTKFSAAYDDDETMEDIEGDLERERQKERDLLDDAAKRAPVFQIPEGFSFAKETKPIEHDTTNVKEPPLPVLPFSFTKPTHPLPVSEVSPPASQSQPGSAFSFDISASSSTSVFSSPFQLSSGLAPPIAAARAHSPAPEAAARPPELPSAPTPAPNGVPNFFASSSMFSRPLDVAQASTFALPTSESLKQDIISPSITGAPSGPVKDAENPLWEGESNEVMEAAPTKLFGGATNGTVPSVAPSGFFGSSAATQPAPSISISGSAEQKDVTSTSQQVLFRTAVNAPTLFSKPAETTPSVSFGDGASKVPTPFGESTTPTTPLFGSTLPKVTTPVGGEPTKSAVPASFTFGQPAPPAPSIQPVLDVSTPSFGEPAPAVEAPKAAFGGGAFPFGITGATDKEMEVKPTRTPFSFGAAPSTPPPVEAKQSMFTFGAPAPSKAPSAPSSIGFSFSGGGTNASDVSGRPFSFGQPAVIASTNRPSTPPKNQDQEFSMEESPTRDVQEMNKPTERPTLGGGGFSFGPTTSGTAFGGQTTGPMAPFSFGSSASTTNPFAKDNKPEVKPFGGSFGQAATASASPFGFGQPKPLENEPVRPSTAGPFAFGSPPTSATGSAPTFGFGGPGNNGTSGTFGQSQPSGSAPSSPSTFNQASPFTFGAPLPPVHGTFPFGSSQPTSPAGGNTSLTLPQPAAPGGFGGGGGGFGQPQPSSPFGAHTAPAPTGGALFTIGAAPAPAPAAGARQIRKLPNRRGGAKR
ncbi:hypothetical protein Hypma_011384 [Hypsizygus marmoreus]|uniref:Uncharacterized protein n=1 Tax=Hypsizygus marmoreus TaxID=39966 RepID=A0A369JRD4_HYPMA|nr:hypothetical protein Hypma_011384 [Hypsizygus marmoreus]